MMMSLFDNIHIYVWKMRIEKGRESECLGDATTIMYVKNERNFWKMGGYCE